MPPDRDARPTGSPEQQPGGVLRIVGMAAAMVACCAGLPLVAGAGITLGAAGAVAGSAVLVAAGMALGVFTWRHHHASTRCAPPRNPSRSPAHHDRT
ncbi:MAG: hypothetical protein ACRD2C_16210 [Acidimicrobiales bacterium]